MGVKVVGDKMMIPADQLKIPDELCKKNNERVTAKFDPEEKDKEETQSDSPPCKILVKAQISVKMKFLGKRGNSQKSKGW